MSRRPQRVQLHRALSKLGICSRTLARDWIRAGCVRVDGNIVADPLTWVDIGVQKITCRRQSKAKLPGERLVLALHKPAGIVTTRSDERGRRTVYDLLDPDLPWIFPVGRLDADSEGLLILTNDSALGEQLTQPARKVPKTYRVTVAGVPEAAALENLRKGVDLPDGRTLPASVHLVEAHLDRAVLQIVLREGKNRQIRRMCKAVGHRVRRLLRVAIGEFELGKLRPGQWRQLTESEIRKLAVARSS